MKFRSQRNAVILLADNAYNFLEEEYTASIHIHKIIATYTQYLATAQMARLTYRDTTNEETISINRYYSELDKWIFNTLQDSLIKEFPNKQYYARQVYELYDNDISAAMNAICGELTNKIDTRFVIKLWHSMKKYYGIALQKYFPNEYKKFLTDKNNLEDIWDELYSLSVEILGHCLKHLGLKIYIINRNKIIYDSVKFYIDKNNPINIIASIIFEE